MFTADDCAPQNCARECVAECLKLAPGSKDYCEANCADACDKSKPIEKAED